MNSVSLVGRITRDPELKYTQTSNIPVVQFNIALDNGRDKDGNKRQADFISITVYNNQAENFAKYCKRGSLISVEGRLKTMNWIGEDGNKRYKTYVLAGHISYLDTKKENVPIPEPPSYMIKQQEEPQPDPFAEFGEEFKNMELPFDADIEVDPEHRPW